MRPLGQHFLKTTGPLRRIVDALEPRPCEVIVEIGPGHGELTSHLIEAARLASGMVISIEKDAKLVPPLRERFKGERFEVIEGDALKLLPQLAKERELAPGQWLLTGNLPYYISGYLFRTLQGMNSKPRKLVFLLQKEVGERVAAKPPEMNKLAASVQFWATPSLLGIVSRSEFRPAPRVDGAILELQPHLPEGREESFYSLVRVLFRQPRKTILNNLSAGYPLSKTDLTSRLQDIHLSPEARPQDIGLAEIRKLAEILTA